MSAQTIITIAGIIAIIIIVVSNQDSSRKIFEIITAVLIPVMAWFFPHNASLPPPEPPISIVDVSPTPDTPIPTKVLEQVFDTETFVKSYLGAMTMAINNRDFSIVSGFLSEGSGAYNEQKNYIEGQSKENNLKESLVSVKILSENRANSDTIIVHARETYDISSTSHGQRTSTFETEYTIKIIGSDGKITNINNLTKENYN